MKQTKTSNYFECKLRYDKVCEDGITKKVTETYVVEAFNWTKAEFEILKFMEPFFKSPMDYFEISDIKRAEYKEIYFDREKESSDKWFKAKIQFLTIDENSGKEKKQTNSILINASSFDEASKYLGEIMSGTMTDYQKSKLSETNIMGVFETE